MRTTSPYRIAVLTLVVCIGFVFSACSPDSGADLTGPTSGPVFTATDTTATDTTSTVTTTDDGGVYTGSGG